MARTPISIAALVGVGIIPSQGGGGSVSLPMPSSVASVVGFGDSITLGTAASDAAHRWLNLVATALNAGTPLNQGSSGTVLQNSNDSGGSVLANNGRDRYISALLGANKRELAIIAYGLNDARYTTAPSTMNVANYRNDLKEVILGLVGGGYTRDRIVIVTPHYVTNFGFTQGSTGFTGQNRSGYEAYVLAARDLAAELGVYLADTYAVMLAAGAEPALNSEGSNDGIHPGDNFMQVIANAVLAAKRVPVVEPDYSAYFLYETFSDSNEFLTNHSGEKNAYWPLWFGNSPVNPARVANGRFLSLGINNNYRNAPNVAPSADVEVTASLVCLTALSDDNIGIAARVSSGADTGYFARYSRTAGNIGLFKIVAGTLTSLGTFNTVIAAGSTKELKLRVQGTSVKALLDGVEIISATDSAIAGAGYVGIRAGTVASGTTGVQIDTITGIAL